MKRDARKLTISVQQELRERGIKMHNKGFKYPNSFLNIVNIKEVPYPDPYFFLGVLEEFTKKWNNNIKKQYPTRILVPFAKDERSDDVFCFDGTDTSGNPKVYMVHTYASPGWEDRGYWDNFDGWYDDIQLESIKYKEEMEEDE